jgi:hypothetical protein
MPAKIVDQLNKIEDERWPRRSLPSRAVLVLPKGERPFMVAVVLDANSILDCGC